MPQGEPIRGDRVGRREPRLWTQPLRPLNRKTTRGYEVIDFARDVLGEPLRPWQQWLVIHALELNPDDTYRYRTVIVLVARQNGKTHLSKVLALWRLYMDGARLVLGAAQDLSIAQEVLDAAEETALDVPELSREIADIRKANGQQMMRLRGGGRYIIKAATRSAARGLTVDHLSMDEVREQQNWTVWSAMSKTTSAVANGQIWCLSNAGDENSVVLNHLRSAAGASINESGVSEMGPARDETIGLFEWSGPENCDLDDWTAIAQANPSLGIGLSEASIRSSLTSDPPEVFRTEVLCQKVDSLNAAVDAAAWKACFDPLGSFDGLRDDVALCLDVAPDGMHACLSAAAETRTPGVYRVEVVAAWDDVNTMWDEWEGWKERVAPTRFGWFPNSPAASGAAVLRREEHTEVKGTAVNEACMGFAELVNARKIRQPGDPLADAHVLGANKLKVGDEAGWRFVRKGVGHCTAAYSMAGAIHILRTVHIEQEVVGMVF